MGKGLAALALLLLVATAGNVTASSDALAPSFAQILAPTERSHDASCALMAAWVESHPGDPRAARGLVWMAQLRIADQRRDLAQPLFQRVQRDYPGTEWAQHSIKGLADLDVEARRYGAAIAKYESLAHSDSPFFQYVGSMAAEHARQLRLRFRSTLGLLASLLRLGGLRLGRLGSWRPLWPPPVEVIYPLPLLLLTAVASLGQPAQEGHSVLILAFGAAALLWVNGAYLRARPPTGAWRIVHGALGLGQAAALLYLAVVLSGLWDKFHDTLVMGAD